MSMNSILEASSADLTLGKSPIPFNANPAQENSNVSLYFTFLE